MATPDISSMHGVFTLIQFLLFMVLKQHVLLERWVGICSEI